MATLRRDGRYQASKATPQGRVYGYGASAAEAEADLAAKLKPECPSGSLSRFVDDSWWPRQKVRCKVLTQKRYRSIYKLHIEPAIGADPLESLTPDKCQAIITACMAKRMAPKSIHLVSHVLSGICRHAVRTGLLSRSPCEGIALPRLGEKRQKSLTLAQVRDLLAAAETAPGLAVRVFLGLVLGLRRGEVAALRWDDLDRQNRILMVRRQKTDAKGDGGVTEGPTKSGKARMIPLTGWMVGELDRLGDLDSPYIAGGGAPDLVTKQWASRRKSLGLGDWTYHDLRHAAASTLNALGVDLVTIAAILGHSKVDMTLLYANAVEGSARNAMETVDNRLRDDVRTTV